VEVGMVTPPPRIAALLDVPEGGQVLRRQRLARWDHEAAEIVTWWIPAHLAEGTDLPQQEPLRGGVRAHLAHRTGRRIDHVIEQVTARHPDPAEAKLLGITKSAPVLAVYVTAREASGIPVLGAGHCDAGGPPGAGRCLPGELATSAPRHVSSDDFRLIA
ncbi:MAG: UTRA domain-containing protein, partial [Streptosporangiaceae bacterium]